MKAKYKWLILISIVFVVGIISWFITNAKDPLSQQILDMQGKRISLDFKNARSVINGKDSLFQNSLRLKLIMFVDSTSCSGCLLNHLVKYYEINDSLTRHNGELLVVLHPRKSRIPEIESRLNNETFPFWCILDRDGEFIEQNQFIPSNPLLHTFTIDETETLFLWVIQYAMIGLKIYC